MSRLVPRPVGRRRAPARLARLALLTALCLTYACGQTPAASPAAPTAAAATPMVAVASPTLAATPTSQVAATPTAAATKPAGAASPAARASATLAAGDDYRPLAGPHIGYGFNGYFTFQPIADPNQLANLRRSLDLVKESRLRLDPAADRLGDARAAARPVRHRATGRLRRHRARGRRSARSGIMFSVAKAPRWAVPGDEFCHDGGGVQAVRPAARSAGAGAR